MALVDEESKFPRVYSTFYHWLLQQIGSKLWPSSVKEASFHRYIALDITANQVKIMTNFGQGIKFPQVYSTFYHWLLQQTGSKLWSPLVKEASFHRYIAFNIGCYSKLGQNYGHLWSRKQVSSGIQHFLTVAVTANWVKSMAIFGQGSKFPQVYSTF